MDIRQLRYFLTVVEAGSLTKASNQLDITQPGLGQQIRNLEREYGVPLVTRHSRGIEVTEAGAILAEYAKKIISDVDEAARKLRDHVREPTGRVTLGMTPVTSTRLAGPLIRKIAAEAPSIDISIVGEMSSVLMEWAANDELQLALVYNVVPTPGLRWEPVLQETLFFVESAACGKTNGGTITVAEVAEHVLVVPGHRHSTRRILEYVAANAGIKLDIACEVQSVQILQDLVTQNIAATVMPIDPVRRLVEAGQLVAKRIVEPEVRRDLFLVYSDRRPLSKAELTLKQILLGLIQSEFAQQSEIWSPIPDRNAALELVERRARS